MDIDVAAAASLQPLTLGEKALGRALFYSQRIHGSENETGTVCSTCCIFDFELTGLPGMAESSKAGIDGRPENSARSSR